MENNDKRVKISVSSMTEALRREGRGHIKSDVLGSYTGSPDNYDDPVQDADDL